MAFTTARYVYAIRHNPTGKIYVGSTYHEVEFRVRQHIVKLRNHKHPIENMQSDFDEYGDDYSYFILFLSSNTREVFDREKDYMSMLRTRDPEYGYNYKDHSYDFSLDELEEYKVPEKYESEEGEQ